MTTRDRPGPPPRPRAVRLRAVRPHLPRAPQPVTRGVSDFSLAPVPGRRNRPVTVRTGRSGAAVTVRARRADGPWRPVRLAPLPADAAATAGPAHGKRVDTAAAGHVTMTRPHPKSHDHPECTWSSSTWPRGSVR
ncbi:DUF1349 domain-containing protein [Kitasatospora sp. NPDC127111]|uniref:DUF1349 domain-containing protein n=1 Tax=Kitasatospora sp. NPDC127111 TaxID=3345363 RepID=UPI00362AB654